jgi:hypothetical protein
MEMRIRVERLGMERAIHVNGINKGSTDIHKQQIFSMDMHKQQTLSMDTR